MSKAIEGAALLAGAVGMGFAAFMDPALLASPLFDKAWGMMILGGLSMEAGAIAGALTSNRGMDITTRQSAAARQVIYGEQRVGGVYLYKSTTGSKHDQFNFVIVIAGHECDSIVNLYLDGRQVYWEVGSGGNSTRNGVNFGGACDGNDHIDSSGRTYNFGGGDGGYHVYCEARYGDQVAGDVITGLTANDPNWAATSAGSPYVGGCCYVYLKIEYDTNLFPAEPEIKFTVRGKNDILDPRTGQRGYSNNWALCLADAISSTDFGLGDTAINQAQLIAAANVSDEMVTLASSRGAEKRYTTNYHTDTNTSPGDVIQTMMSGAQGRLSQIAGEWYIFAATWVGPSASFSSADLTGPVQWTPYRPYRELYNRVNGTYIAAVFPYSIAGDLYDSNGYFNGQIQNNFNLTWNPTNYPQFAIDQDHGYPADQLLAEDGGNQLPMELGFQTVISIAQAQRCAKIALLRNRQQGSGTFQVSLEMWAQLQENDVFLFTFPEMGWTDKQLEVVGSTFQIAEGDDGIRQLRVNMQVQECDASVYAWSTREELPPSGIPVLPPITSFDPQPPTDMLLTSGIETALITADGVVHPRILVTWNEPLDIYVKTIQIQYSPLGSDAQIAGTWLTAGIISVENDSFYINNVVAGQPYDVRIRSVRGNGSTSVWDEIDNYVVSLTLSQAGQLIPLAPNSCISNAYNDNTADIEVSPFTAELGLASVRCLQNTGTYYIRGLKQSTLYYIWYYDPNFIGGNITPIATENTADFLNKGPGFFLIDQLLTAYSVMVPGGITGMKYAPTYALSTGNRTVLSATNSIDGNTNTVATVSALATSPVLESTGNLFWSGIQKTMLAYDATYYVVINSCVFANTGGSSTATIKFDIGGLNGPNLSYLNPPIIVPITGPQTYTFAVPKGTDLSICYCEIDTTATIGPNDRAPNGAYLTASVTVQVAEAYIA